MININCENERKHTVWDKNEESYVVENCKALLCCVDNLDNGNIYAVCRVCKQKWKISIVNGEIEVCKLPKKYRFEFDDQLKVEL